MDNGQWTMDNGQWTGVADDNGEWNEPDRGDNGRPVVSVITIYLRF